MDESETQANELVILALHNQQDMDDGVVENYYNLVPLAHSAWTEKRSQTDRPFIISMQVSLESALWNPRGAMPVPGEEVVREEDFWASGSRTVPADIAKKISRERKILGRHGEFENASIFHPFSSSVSDRECGDSTRVDATELRWGWGGSSEYVATAFDVWSPVCLASAARLYSEGSISTCHRDREKLVVL
ncbi:unnamed protein product [Sphagnum balticum]